MSDDGMGPFASKRLEMTFVAWATYNEIEVDDYWRSYWWKNISRTKLSTRWFAVTDALMKVTL